MYILLHTYTYAITVYVLLRCIAFFQRAYILCAYYNPLSMNLMYTYAIMFLLIYLLGVAMDTEPYPVVAGLLIRKAVTW